MRIAVARRTPAVTRLENRTSMFSKKPAVAEVQAGLVSSRWKSIDKLLAALVLALGFRVVYLFVRYVFGLGPQRFHVESWSLIFLTVGLAVRLVLHRRFAEVEPTRASVLGPWLWFVFCGLTVALYWPALSFGARPTDSVLMTDASQWNIAGEGARFRPLPILLWALLLQLGVGPTALHLVNLVLHGTNAYLATKVMAAWVDDRKWSLLGGLLVLTAPLAAEAVVSLSRVPDLLATTLVLMSILVARRYDDHPSWLTRCLYLALGIAAVASQETAAIAGGLAVLDAFVRGHKSRRLFSDTAILLSVVGIYGLVRLASVDAIVFPRVTKFVMQVALFRSFGALAVPWHTNVIERHPWLPILAVAGIVYLLTTFFLDTGASKRQTKVAIVAAGWILLSIAPVFPIVVINPDLEPSRYLYLSAIGWAGLMAALASGQRRLNLRSVSLTALCVLVAIASTGALLHVGYAADEVRTERHMELLRKDLFAELQPTRLANCEFQRFGEPRDGGYLLCTNLLSSVQSGYWYGISGYDQWGCNVARRPERPDAPVRLLQSRSTCLPWGADRFSRGVRWGRTGHNRGPLF